MKKTLFAFIFTAMYFAAPYGSCSAANGPEIGNPAPDFSLTDIHGKKVSLSEFQGKYIVLEWMNFQCPFIKKHYDTGNMQALQKEFRQKGVVWLSICSSAKGKEGYMEPEEWEKVSRQQKSDANAILLDPFGTVGKNYAAKTTPHMFIIDPKGILIYKGAIDDKPSTEKEDVKTAKNYVREALDAALNGKNIDPSDTKSYGCSVKY